MARITLPPLSNTNKSCFFGLRSNFRTQITIQSERSKPIFRVSNQSAGKKFERIVCFCSEDRNGRQKKKLQQSELLEEELATEDKKEKKMQHLAVDVGSLLDEKHGVRHVIGVYLITILILGVYLADHWFQVPEMKKLYLYHNNPVWYQFVTSLFCHFNRVHLFTNVSVLYFSGRVVEENEGFFAFWIYYIFTGVIASYVGFLFLKGNFVSLGASGATWGLCAICASIRWHMTWSETFISLAGIYLIEKGIDRVRPASSSSVIYNTIAHYTGAIAGVGVVWIRSKLDSKGRKNP